MSLPDDTAHHTAIRVAVPADFAFDRLSDAAFVGGWSLGSMGLQPVGAGVFRGQSLFDGSDAHVEIHPNPALGLIDFAVGSADTRVPRIWIRVAAGGPLGFGADTCVVGMGAWRAATTTDDIWARTRTSHETEIRLIKAQLDVQREVAQIGQPPHLAQEVRDRAMQLVDHRF